MAKQWKPIDGTKNDVRVLCTGQTDSEDAGLVEGVPIDPPDDSPGWVLMDLWVEHDTVQVQEKAEKGEKGSVITRKVNPAYYQLWVKPKPPTARKPKQKAPKAPEPASAAPKRERKAKGNGQPKPPENNAQPPLPITTPPSES